jgi:hypothetical protein
MPLAPAGSLRPPRPARPLGSLIAPSIPGIGKSINRLPPPGTPAGCNTRMTDAQASVIRVAH